MEGLTAERKPGGFGLGEGAVRVGLACGAKSEQLVGGGGGMVFLSRPRHCL